jgi:O-antigen/teichoic acid export membrane protein
MLVTFFVMLSWFLARAYKKQGGWLVAEVNREKKCYSVLVAAGVMVMHCIWTASSHCEVECYKFLFLLDITNRW